MKKYISVELQREIREHFANSCAYCRTAEILTSRSAQPPFIISEFPFRWPEDGS
jgi:hypothetical protein